jgi:predicted ribosome quality control (RQC) complex YloA/Tae2 family protein
MALDGTVIAALVKEMKDNIVGGRMSKIAQPETDELILTIKLAKTTKKLLICANPSLPLVYFTEQNKPNPATAPNFCMLLRKHIGNGKITSVCQPNFERVIDIEIEHFDELGDLKTKHLIVELMGKHSNIIFCDDAGKILDSIKHVSAQVSSVREVLPGRPYFIPQTTTKMNPLTITQEDFIRACKQKNYACGKVLYSILTGFSPIIGEEICYRANIDSDTPSNELSEMELLHLYKTFSYFCEDIIEEHFSPHIIYNQDLPVEFSVVPLTCYSKYQVQAFDDISTVLSTYYATKSTISRIRQKSADLRKIVHTALERNVKKYDLQLKQLKDTEKREKFRIYGELINAYGYSLPEGADKLVAENYYDDNKEISIPLDTTLSASENAKHYFERYNKLKRTYEALSGYIQETADEIQYLQSVSTSLDIALEENDLTQIKEELREAGYIKKRAPKEKKAKITSKPFHYRSSDGFDIYVGKNNYQNEELTFKFASGNDWWFHAKKIPGSHVIVKTNGQDLPDHTFEEAAQLAAYYSSARDAQKVEIDYVERKHVKKVNGGKPGFVIYHTNYSMVASPVLQLETVE